MKALIQAPRSAAEGTYQAATIYDPTPYGVGTVDDEAQPSASLYNEKPFDYNLLLLYWRWLP